MSLTPYSCCKKNSVCYGNTIREKVSQLWIELPASINMTLINEEGCLKIFSARLDEICAIIFVVVGIVFLLQVRVVHSLHWGYKANVCYFQIFILILMVVLMYKKAIGTKRTANYQSQTDLPTGVSQSFKRESEWDSNDHLFISIFSDPHTTQWI